MVKMSDQCANMVTMGLWATDDVNNYNGTYALPEQSTNYVCADDGDLQGDPLSRSQSLYELKKYKCCTLWICYTLQCFCRLQLWVLYIFYDVLGDFATAMELRIPSWKDIILGEQQRVHFSEIAKFNNE